MPATRPPVPVPRTSFVGREREQAALRDALAAALTGRGSLVLIGGEAGIGKTALAEVVLAEAPEQGALALVGRCYDLAETPPYGPWTEALARAPRADGLPSPPDLSGGAGVASQAALFARVLGHLAALANQRPLVLLLEDLHWADPASLDLLRHLGRGVADFPLLLLATYRADEVSRHHPLYTRLPVLVREARAERLDLRPLDEAALAALVAARYAPSPDDAGRLVAYLRAHAGGNPFYAGELLRSLEEGGALRRENGGWTLGDLAELRVPPLLRQVIDARVDRLGEQARELLVAAAVVGQEIPLPRWASVAAAEAETLLDLIERAAAARVLEPTPEGARFAHPLIRAALYEGTPPLRRRTWHRRAAEALLAAATLAGGYPSDPDALAYHLRQAGDPRAAEWLFRAGLRAQRAFAGDIAAARFAATLATLERALADAPPGGPFPADEENSAFAAYVRLALGSSRLASGAVRDGIAEMEAAVAALEDRPRGGAPIPGALRTLVGGFADHVGILAQGLVIAGQFERGAALLARDPDTAVSGQRANASLLLHAYLGHTEAALDAYRAGAPPGSYQLAVQAGTSVVARYLADRPQERRAFVEGLAAAAVRSRDFPPGLSRRAVLLPFLLLGGQWDEARALAMAVRAGVGRGRLLIMALRELGALARAQGDAGLARSVVAELVPRGVPAEPGDALFFIETEGQLQAAWLALDAGDLPAARPWLEAHDRWLAWSGAVLGRAERHLAWAAYHHAAGDPAQARAHAGAALAQATDPRQPVALLAAHRTLGEFATEAGDYPAAQAHLDHALALADACEAPYERALSLLALTGLRVAAGRTDEARAPLGEARALLGPLGAAPALARAAALAARLGTPATGRDAGPTPVPAGLSPREVDVLRLLASGRSNKAIAAALGMSVRTLERHIANLYNKIDAAGRAEAIAFAHRHGLT